MFVTRNGFPAHEDTRWVIIDPRQDSISTTWWLSHVWPMMPLAVHHGCFLRSIRLFVIVRYSMRTNMVSWTDSSFRVYVWCRAKKQRGKWTTVSSMSKKRSARPLFIHWQTLPWRAHRTRWIASILLSFGSCTIEIIWHVRTIIRRHPRHLLFDLVSSITSVLWSVLFSPYSLFSWFLSWLYWMVYSTRWESMTKVGHGDRTCLGHRYVEQSLKHLSDVHEEIYAHWMVTGPHRNQTTNSIVTDSISKRATITK